MISPGVISGIFTLGKGLLGIVDKSVEDKDKKAELSFRVVELTFSFYERLLATPTVPWVDALIKFILVTKDLARPVGSFGLAFFAAYCQAKGTPLPETIQYLMYGAPVAWGASRHKEKVEKVKAQNTGFEDITP